MTNVSHLDPFGGFVARYDYGYDYDWPSGTNTMLGQRTSLSVTAVAAANQPNGQTKYSYEPLYQLTRVDYPSYSETQTYDAIGNRTSRGFSNSSTSQYTYYKNGTNPTNGQRLRNDGSTPGDFQYDANGNLTASTVYGTLATWDFANRLALYVGTTYAYDYLGRRTTATTASGTTRYVSVGLNTVRERGPNVSNDYLFGPGIDEPLAKRAADGSLSYYGADALGSVTLVTDSNANMLEGDSYSAWGERSSGSQLFGYTGREAGGPAWFYRARYYDAPHGRFVSEDSLAYNDGPNVYSYVDNDPIINSDPSGNIILRCMRPLRPYTFGWSLGPLWLSGPFWPIPGNHFCPMHEYLWDTDQGVARGFGPGPSHTRVEEESAELFPSRLVTVLGILYIPPATTMFLPTTAMMRSTRRFRAAATPLARTGQGV